jgi:hypothetical protein
VSSATRETFVGVDLRTNEVVAVALFPDLIRDAYILRGQVDSEGRIVLDPDDTYNGRAATKVCLASQGCGLGWQFAETV